MIVILTICIVVLMGAVGLAIAFLLFPLLEGLWEGVKEIAMCIKELVRRKR